MRRGKVISFQLPEEQYSLLVSRCAKGASPGSYARELMLRALHAETTVDAIEVRLAHQQKQLDALRSDLRFVLRSSLVAFGRIDADKANEWVNNVMG